jgi:uncharacterized paraquat-inducible protein A
MTWTPDEDWEPDAEDGSEEDDSTVACPYCSREIHEESERCPHCGNYISEEEAPSSSRPKWFVVTAVICLVFVVLWILNC